MTKEKTVSIRLEEHTFDFFEDYAEEHLGVSKSDAVRNHIEALEENEFYRQLHTELQNSGFEGLNKILEENEAIDTDYVNMTEIDYERLFRDIETAVLDSRGENYEGLHDLVDDLRDDGYQREAHLIHSMASAYEK